MGMWERPAPERSRSQGTAGATTDNVNVWVWVMELADSGLPDTPVAVSVTGAGVTGALRAAVRTKV
jgi:hypothetical protein